ncbi:hypothetical protein HDV05_001800, partial [Chytridiales sp. JEL 0842]
MDKDNTPLHLLCSSDNITDATIEQLDILLKDDDLDVNARNFYGDTALILLCKKGHFDLVKRLLCSTSDSSDTNNAKKINVNLANDHGNTALHYACFYNHKAIVAYLLKEVEGVQVGLENRYGKRAADVGRLGT